MSETVKVVANVKSAIESKVIWSQILPALFSVMLVFGIDVPAETKANLVLGIQGVAGLITCVIRAKFSPDVLEGSATNLRKWTG